MRILIVGLRKEHFKKLCQRYTNMSIDVLDDQKRHNKAVVNANEYDHIISLVKFTNQTTHQHYRNHPGYHVTPGGYSSVVNLLGTFVC